MDLTADEATVRSLKPRLSIFSSRFQAASERWEASVRGPLLGASYFDGDRALAVAGLAQVLAYMRLPGVLRSAGWTHIAHIVDEVEVITATAPDGIRWAIAVGDAADRRLPAFVQATAGESDKWAVVAPIATLDPSALTRALSRMDS